RLQPANNRQSSRPRRSVTRPRRSDKTQTSIPGTDGRSDLSRYFRRHPAAQAVTDNSRRRKGEYLLARFMNRTRTSTDTADCAADQRIWGFRSLTSANADRAAVAILIFKHNRKVEK